jgi:hypothetical protein
MSRLTGKMGQADAQQIQCRLKALLKRDIKYHRATGLDRQPGVLQDFLLKLTG